MTPKANLAYLSQPAPGVFILNVQLQDTEHLARIEVTANQVRGFIADGAAMAFRARDDSAHQSIRVNVEKSDISRQASPEQK